MQYIYGIMYCRIGWLFNSDLNFYKDDHHPLPQHIFYLKLTSGDLEKLFCPPVIPHQLANQLVNVIFHSNSMIILKYSCWAMYVCLYIYI